MPFFFCETASMDINVSSRNTFLGIRNDSFFQKYSPGYVMLDNGPEL